MYELDKEVNALDYIEEVLGERVKRQAWREVDKLPYYFSRLYTIQQVKIGVQDCLMLIPRDELGTISAIKKQIARLNNDWNGPVVFELDKLSRQRKQTFIKERIPFVVPGKQLYLPFMGAMLQEKNDIEGAAIIRRLQPSAQMLLFSFIYGKNTPLYLSQISSQFRFSSMTMSRAATQLSSVGLVEEHKEGVQRVLTTSVSPKELFEKAKPYLFNPVRRRVYLDKALIQEDFFPAGLSALAKESMLCDPEVAVYGTVETLRTTSDSLQLIDSDNQCEIELWRYNPTILCDEEKVDILSLAMSLDDVRDERVEMAIEEMLEKVWR